MSFLKLSFRPGIDQDITNYAGEGGWFACDRTRFNAGFPLSIGGWQKAIPYTFDGVCRQLHNWVTTFNDNFLAIGTNTKLYIEAGGNVFDITPLEATFTAPSTNNMIATVITSTTVTVNLGVPHNAETGSTVIISGASAVGGIPAIQINGSHEITVIDADSFSFVVTTPATSTVAAGGGVAITLGVEIDPGFAVATAGYGWGVGTWGRGAWGSGAATPILFPQRDWWYDNFDNDLIANIRNGPIYLWQRGTLADPATALATRAALLSAYSTSVGLDPTAVPVKVMQILVSQQDRHLLAFGAVPFGSTDPKDFDPMLIRWSDQDNFGQWVPEVTNSAGFIRVSRGSRIVRALPVRQEILVFTDTNLYTLQFLGTTDVFGLQQYAERISIISPRAVDTASNVTYWMGKDKFYAYTGRVETLDCSLQFHVFDNLNLGQTEQIVSGLNDQWNEIWWFYPSGASDYNDSYVVYNYLERLWFYGTIDRTAWLDTALRQYIQAMAAIYTPELQPDGSTVITATSHLFNQEFGVDAEDQPLNSFLLSNDFDLGEGDQFMLTRRIIPDFSFAGSVAPLPTIDLQVRPRRFPGVAATPDVEDTAPVIETSVDIYTEQVFVRARARQMALKISANTLGVAWRLGACRLDLRPDGRR